MSHPEKSTSRESRPLTVAVLIVAMFAAGYAARAGLHRANAATPDACTKAALLAEQNQLDWEARDQGHIDAEHAALDRVTFHQFRRILADNIPARPAPVNLGVCR